MYYCSLFDLEVTLAYISRYVLLSGYGNPCRFEQSVDFTWVCVK